MKCVPQINELPEKKYVTVLNKQGRGKTRKHCNLRLTQSLLTKKKRHKKPTKTN